MENKFFVTAIFLLLGIMMITSHLTLPVGLAADDEGGGDDDSGGEGGDDGGDSGDSKSEKSDDDRSNEEKQSSDNDHDDCVKIRPGWNKNYYANKCRHDKD